MGHISHLLLKVESENTRYRVRDECRSGIKMK
uniref:Uncharacterized protein n=1 Tax=Rhizophora mucronata TaxID=61149 RepID=A0A2P2NR31_RHIMU